MRHLFLIMIVFSLLINYAFASEKTLNFSVPFQNVFLNPNGKIQANFSFGPHKIIFCFANDGLSVLSINWPYRGSRVSGQLPIALKTAANIDGSFSDPSGILTIQNSSNHGIAIVNCVFGF